MYIYIYEKERKRERERERERGGKLLMALILMKFQILGGTLRDF